ncbi:MAG TPA: polysaccharide biosynthesis tyrosine autokinase [Flavobacterium sp.]|jgi:capsular exopolysaccharide synthesis family protein
MQQHPSLSKDPVEESLSIREEVDKYLIHWKWFLLAVALGLIAANIYLRYAVPQYRATATIMVKDDRKGGLQSELSAFGDLGIMNGVKSNVENEIEVISSRGIAERAIKKLNLTVQYFTEGRVKSVEVYKDRPITVTFLNASEEFYNYSGSFIIKSVSAEQFELLSANEKSLGKFTYGKRIRMGNLKFVVTARPIIQGKIAKFEIAVVINKLAHVAQHYNSMLTIPTTVKNTSVVQLSMQDPVKEKAEDILDAIIEVYNEDAIADKNFISENTKDFVAERLEYISEELGDVEKTAESFKKSNRLTDITSEAGIYLENSVEFEKSLIETETQLRIVESMMDFMSNSSTTDLIPGNIIPDDQASSSLIGEHNSLVLQRNRVSKGATTKSSVIINLDEKIAGLRENIQQSLQRLTATLNIKKRDLEKQNNVMQGKISEIPGQERVFRGITRQQNIKEALYLYLLQKREEIAISLAVTAPNAKVIDTALSSSAPVSPNRQIIYLGAFVLGLIIPFGVIYLNQLLDTKIKNRLDIENKLNIPYLGDIPRSHTQYEIIHANHRSSSAEAMRIARTNLEFMLSEVPDNVAKTIFVTSTLPKEGKTFISINMASTIALSGKKVLLIGMDIRNPKIDQYIKLPEKGLTNYLSQKGNGIHDYIVKLDNFQNLYVLPSGIIAPNPVELLMNPKLDSMFSQLKQEYDYIIVDTAPVSVVTDTLVVAKYADAFIYVMRANYLDKRMLKVAESFYTAKKLPNMAIILNDTIWRKTYGSGNGYGYGYGYVESEIPKPWYKKLLS